MLQLLKTLDPEDVFYDSFIQNETGIVKVICPSPAKADEMRRAASSAGLADKLEVSTMARFVSDELAQAFPDEELKFYRKSQLMLELSVVWKKTCPDIKVDVFFQAFNVFTELRSSSLDLNLMSEALDHYGEMISRPVKTFWLYLDHMKIMDEHSAFHLLAEKFRENVDVPDEEEALLFWGFSHMSGVQVDFIKARSIRKNVGIQFPASVLNEVRSSDWIDWLFDIEKEDFKEPGGRDLKVVGFARNRLSQTMKAWMKHDQVSELDVYLGTKSVEVENALEIPVGSVFFKSQADIFKEELALFLEEIDDLFIDEDSDRVTHEKVESFIEQKTREFAAQSFEKKNFRRLKILIEFKKYFSEWTEMSEANQEFSVFDLKVLDEYLGLNLPRVSMIPIQADGGHSRLKSITEMASLGDGKINVLCASGSYRPLVGSDKTFTEETLEVLSAIGPLRRGELDFALLKDSVRSALRKHELTLFLEEGLLEHDRAWREILNGFVTRRSDVPALEEVKKKDVFSGRSMQRADQGKKLSATYLQSFLDCKRKFYFSYVEPVKLYHSADYILEPRHLGEIEHEVIEYYFMDDKPKDIRELAAARLGAFLGRQHITLSNNDFKKYLYEIESYSRNGVNFVLALKKAFEADLSFEKKIEEEGAGGSIDLFIDGPGVSGVVDFKRSASSIPAENSIIDQSKVQLWYYLKHVGIEMKDSMVLGYFNLSDPQKSRLYSSCDSLEAALKEVFQDKAPKVGEPPFNIVEKLEEYNSLEQATVKAIAGEEIFPANPRGSDVCMFCEIKNVCNRGMA